MTPIFEKINTMCWDSISGLKPVPATWPGPGPPFAIFKKFPQTIFFLKFFAFFAVFDQNSPHHHPYAFPAKKIDFGRKNVLLRKGEGKASLKEGVNTNPPPSLAKFFFSEFKSPPWLAQIAPARGLRFGGFSFEVDKKSNRLSRNKAGH